jgi:hypothetical protein
MNRFFALGWIVTIAMGTNLANAAPPQEAAKPQARESGAGQAGMKAYVDPETGQLVSRPTTQADAAALDSAFKEDYSKIQEINKADGSTEWVFNGQVDSALVARRGQDGKLEVVCAEHGVVHDHLEAPVAQGGRDER